ncbi:MAG TPA: cytochrome D1 domain-containing protein [Steroidobacteraceae bacterium]|nr:cytochrome D1 domain-containing protein [Steroidobacteraceae bacterium]
MPWQWRGRCLTAALAALTLSQPAWAERVYVSNEDDGTVAVVDADRGAAIAAIAVGKRPRGLALSPDGKLLYVAVSGVPKCPPPITDEECAKLPRDPAANGVAVVDTTKLERTRLLTGVSDPERVAVSRDGRRLYVSEEDAARLAVLDAARGLVLATVPAGREPEGVRVSPNGRWVLVTSEEDNTVTIVDTRSNAILGKATVGTRPRDLAFSPDSRFAYVSGEADASLYRVAVPSGAPAAEFFKLRREVRPMGVALDAGRGRLYVGAGRAGTVAVVALTGPSLITEIACGARPWGVALGAGGRRLYSPNGPSGDLAIVDTETLAVTARIPTGKGPWAVVAGP